MYIDGKKTYNDNGFTPDWEFMDHYMKSIEEKSQGRINILKQLHH